VLASVGEVVLSGGLGLLESRLPKSVSERSIDVS
jgi:hypothetical protein